MKPRTESFICKLINTRLEVRSRMQGQYMHVDMESVPDFMNSHWTMVTRLIVCAPGCFGAISRAPPGDGHFEHCTQNVASIVRHPNRVTEQT